MIGAGLGAILKKAKVSGFGALERLFRTCLDLLRELKLDF